MVVRKGGGEGIERWCDCSVCYAVLHCAIVNGDGLGCLGA